MKGCVHGDKCHFRHVEADGKPNKKSKKGGAKGSVAKVKESIQLGCVSQDSYPRKSILVRHTLRDYFTGSSCQYRVWDYHRMPRRERRRCRKARQLRILGKPLSIVVRRFRSAWRTEFSFSPERHGRLISLLPRCLSSLLIQPLPQVPSPQQGQLFAISQRNWSNVALHFIAELASTSERSRKSEDLRASR